MTVRELIDVLAECDPDAQVEIAVPKRVGTDIEIAWVEIVYAHEEFEDVNDLMPMRVALYY